MQGSMNLVQLLATLRKAQGKRSVRAFAKAIGISHPYLLAVLKQQTTPGPKILAYMGLRSRTSSVTIYEPE